MRLTYLVLNSSLMFIVTCSLVACNNNASQANEKVTTATTETATTPSANSNKTTSNQDVDYRNTLNLVKGKECHKFFESDAAQQYKANDFYINSRRSIFLSDEGIILSNLMIRHNKLQVVANYFYVDKEVCVDEFSPLFISFDDGESHELNGLQKTNCKKVKSKDEPGAIGMYHLPINSKLFKKLLFAKPKSITINVTKGMQKFDAYDEGNAKDFQNAVRCAYEALGHKFDLSNDDILVETALPQ
jgi:hypothetical protein